MPLPYKNFKRMTSKRDVMLRATIHFCEALEKSTHAKLTYIQEAKTMNT